MKKISILLVLLSVLGSYKLVKGDDTESAEELWNKQLEAIQRIAQEVQEPPPSKNTRATGTIDFEVAFEAIPQRKTVHNVEPHDIEIVGALGDSITAGTGAQAATIAGIAIQNRGVSWTVGGDEELDTSITITNILRKFNPQVKGYSVGDGIGYRPREEEDWFNVAVPGGRAHDMQDQANELVRKLKNDTRINFENDWKLISIFIGGNDLCALDGSNSDTPEEYRDHIAEGLDILHANLPKTIVQIVQIMEISLLPEIGRVGVNTSPICPLAQRLACGYVVNADEETKQLIDEINWQYQDRVAEMVASGKYDTRDDFTVLLQPFFEDTVLPVTEDGEIDGSYFAPDCFHFSTKGHAMGALNLWNNMLEPENEKTTEWKIGDLKCPTKEHPFIFTRGNSKGTRSRKLKSKSSAIECPECFEVANWSIGVLCSFGGILVIEVCALLYLVKK